MSNMKKIGWILVSALLLVAAFNLIEILLMIGWIALIVIPVALGYIIRELYRSFRSY